MIKKFLGIATICLLSITTAKAACTIPNGTSTSNLNCYGINYYEGIDFSNSSYSYYMGTISNSGFNFSSYYDNVFMYSTNKSKVLYNVLNYWWQSDGLHYTRRYDENTNVEHGKVNGFYVCSDTTVTFPGNAYNFLSSRSNCVYHDGFSELNQYLIDINSPSFACTYNHNSNKNINCVLCLNGGSSICFDLSNKTVIEEVFYSSSEVANLAIKNPFYSKGGQPQRDRNTICPTMGKILNNYPTAYNTGLCYNSTLRYNNGQIETVEQNTIQETFTNYNELQERWNIYNNNCRVPFTQEQCQGAFSGQRNKYSIISNAFNGNTESKRLWNYCNIYLNYDLNMSSCVASGYQGEKFTEKEIQDTLLGLDELKVLTPGTGNILNGLLGSGQTREDINIYDVLGNLEQVKEKITSIFNERHGVDGIIPDYILWLILTTLLLTVLLKK